MSSLSTGDANLNERKCKRKSGLSPGVIGGAAAAGGAADVATQAGQGWRLEEGKGLYYEDQEADVRVCGVPLPLDIPLTWLHATLQYPNNFVYVVVTVS
jgi:Autophagy protein Apg5